MTPADQWTERILAGLHLLRMAKIDVMTQEQLCRHWRFAEIGDVLLQGVVGDYFVAALKRAGGFTPEISKRIGWDR